MPPSAVEALNLFYPAANAAYGSQDPRHLIPGNDFAFFAQIAVDSVKAVQLAPQHLPMLTSMLKFGGVFGFIAKRPGAVFVSFRGTESPEEWLCDFEAFPKTCDAGGGSVHEGFQRVYEVIRDSALQGCKQAITVDDELLVTGHSLGGALAILFAEDASSVVKAIRVCTFAGPRTGLENFAATYNAHVPDTLRVVNHWDIVPNVPVPAPPFCVYEHVGSALVIDGGFTFDLKQAHSLPLSYLPGLKKAVNPGNRDSTNILSRSVSNFSS